MDRATNDRLLKWKKEWVTVNCLTRRSQPLWRQTTTYLHFCTTRSKRVCFTLLFKNCTCCSSFSLSLMFLCDNSEEEKVLVKDLLMRFVFLLIYCLKFASNWYECRWIIWEKQFWDFIQGFYWPLSNLCTGDVNLQKYHQFECTTAHKQQNQFWYPNVFVCEVRIVS